MNFNYPKLVEAFKAAKAAGLAAETVDDGGTCNLDSPAFRYHGVRKNVIEAAAVEAGVSVCDFKWFGGQRWFWLNGFLKGQGNCRMRMSRAATKALKEVAPEGLDVCEYCQMD